MAEKLKVHQLTAENMQQIYDVSCGSPVLHNTALQVSVNYCDADIDGDTVPQVIIYKYSYRNLSYTLINS